MYTVGYKCDANRNRDIHAVSCGSARCYTHI